MNVFSKFVVVFGSLIIVVAATAEQTGGKYENLLVQVLMANVDGECPSSLMADALKDSCDSQLLDVRDKLSKLGKMTKVIYLGAGQMKGGLGERYQVVFEHGDWDWSLNTQKDGRMLWAFAPSPPHWDVASYSLLTHEQTNF